MSCFALAWDRKSLLTGFLMSHKEIDPCIVAKSLSAWEEGESGFLFFHLTDVILSTILFSVFGFRENLGL